MPQAKEGDNTTSQPWSIQWETKAKWEAHPKTAYSGFLCGMGMVSDSWWQLVSCLEFLNVVEFWNQVWLLLWTMFNYVDLLSWVKHGKTVVNHPFGHGFYMFLPPMDGLWHRFTNICLSISHPCYDDPPGMGEVQRKVEGNGQNPRFRVADDWWILMDFDGFWWILMDFDGYWWILMDFDGFWWILMDMDAIIMNYW